MKLRNLIIFIGALSFSIGSYAHDEHTVTACKASKNSPVLYTVPNFSYACEKNPVSSVGFTCGITFLTGSPPYSTKEIKADCNSNGEVMNEQVISETKNESSNNPQKIKETLKDKAVKIAHGQ